MAFATILTAFNAAASVGGGLLGMRAAGAEAAGAKASGLYQAGVARNQQLLNQANAAQAERDAITARENAERAGLAGQLRAQGQDFEARDQIDQFIVQQGASGLTGRSPAAVVSSLERLAARDRHRIAEAGTAEAGGFRAQSHAFRTEAANLRSGAAAAGADAEMILANADQAANAARTTGFTSLLQGFTGGGNALLDGSRSYAVRHDLSKVGDWFQRKFRRPGL